MIIVGLAFRSACLRLTSKNTRKELVRQGLRQIGANMDHVTKAMSNDLHLPDSPRTVIRTYSRYKGTDTGDETRAHDESNNPKAGEREKNINLRVQTLSTSLTKQNEDYKLSEKLHQLENIEMIKLQNQAR